MYLVYRLEDTKLILTHFKIGIRKVDRLKKHVLCSII